MELARRFSRQRPFTAAALILALMAVTLMVQLANAQGRASVVQTITFTAPDNMFLFSYPSDFAVCTKGKMDPCVHSYIPACDQDALVCVDYPAQRFKGSGFEGATFQVKEIPRKHEEMTPDVCVTPYPMKAGDLVEDFPEFLVSAEHPAEMIGGVQFLHGIGGGVATGHSITVDIYRVFHGHRCFELSVSQTGSDPNISDPPLKSLTPERQQRLDQTFLKKVETDKNLQTMTLKRYRKLRTSAKG